MLFIQNIVHRGFRVSLLLIYIYNTKYTRNDKRTYRPIFQVKRSQTE